MATAASRRTSGRILVATALGTLFAVGGGGAVALAQNETGEITVVKYICESINDPTTCTESRDDSLDGYRVEFDVHAGGTDEGAVVQTIVVEIGENPAEEGNVGSGSEGSERGGPLPLDMYTVCDLGVAFRAGEDDVELDVSPRPEETSGGSNQSAYGDECITVDLVPGNNVLKFVNARAMPDGSTVPATSAGFPAGVALPLGVAFALGGVLLLVVTRRRSTIGR